MKKLLDKAFKVLFVLIYMIGFSAPIPVYAAGGISAVSIGSQSPSPVSAGNSATYLLTFTRNGNGSVTATLGISGLPAGAAFSPGVVTEAGNLNFTANLTITTTSSVAAGTYPFTLSAAQTSPAGSTYTANGTLVVTGCTTPTLTWATPAPISYGTALSGTQLNASSGGVSGSFSYSPSAGAVLGVGSNTLNVTFTPTSSAYCTTSTSTSISVNRAVITVQADPKTKTYGSSDPALTYQLTSGSLVGSDTFSGSLSRVSGEAVGTYAIESTLTLDTSKYILVYIGANLTITKASPTITWATPAAINYGT
ncbi:MAG: hypothetical protein FD147_2462, partial [Chloroflexi bacterium]